MNSQSAIPVALAAGARAVRGRRHDDPRSRQHSARSSSKWFLLLAVLVGVNQWLYVAFGACPASIVLRRTCRLRSAIYPNPTDNREHAASAGS